MFTARSGWRWRRRLLAHPSLELSLQLPLAPPVVHGRVHDRAVDRVLTAFDELDALALVLLRFGRQVRSRRR